MDAAARKQRMNARRERLEAVLYWTLLSLDYDAERAARTAHDWQRNTLDTARMIGALVGWDYDTMTLTHRGDGR